MSRWPAPPCATASAMLAIGLWAWAWPASPCPRRAGIAGPEAEAGGGGAAAWAGPRFTGAWPPRASEWPRAPWAAASRPEAHHRSRRPPLPPPCGRAKCAGGGGMGTRTASTRRARSPCRATKLTASASAKRRQPCVPSSRSTASRRLRVLLVQVHLRVGQLLHLGLQQHHHRQLRRLVALLDELQHRVIRHGEHHQRGHRLAVPRRPGGELHRAARHVALACPASARRSRAFAGWRNTSRSASGRPSWSHTVATSTPSASFGSSVTCPCEPTSAEATSTSLLAQRHLRLAHAPRAPPRACTGLPAATTSSLDAQDGALGLHLGQREASSGCPRARRCAARTSRPPSG